LREAARRSSAEDDYGDSLCPLEVLAPIRAELQAPNELHVVEGGDHSLLVTKSHLKQSGQSQDEVERGILQVIGSFLARHVPALF
jgi:hypothetical protein